MAKINSKSYDHDCKRYSGGMFGTFYRLSWTVDFKYHGQRSRSQRTFTRDTDEAGAKRFCKKHGIAWNEVSA